MNPKVKTITYELSENFRVYVFLSPSSRKFCLSYRLYSFKKLAGLEEELLISPSISQNVFGTNSLSSLYRNISGTSSEYTVTDAFGNESIYAPLTIGWDDLDYCYSFNAEDELHVSDGLRLGKTIASSSETSVIDYIYDGDRLILENHSDFQLRFSYDSSGKLLSVEKYDTDGQQIWKYYYLVSATNDVMGLVNESGEITVSYLYDPYGRTVTAEAVSDETSADHAYNLDVLNLNPFMFKSYYHDSETGLYYLRSRYYDPEICRFISHDSADYLNRYALTGLNPYAYCGDDPVNYSDRSGHMAVAVALLILGGIGAVAGFASQSISDAVSGKGFDWGRSGIAAAAGFLGGLCYAIPGVGGYVGAAVSSGLNTIGQMAYSSESYSFGDYAIAGLASAGIGALSSWAFGQLTSGISYFADAGYFLDHFMEFAGDAGGIVLKNSVILQLSGQLLVRNTVSTIANDVFNSVMLLDRGTEYSLRYYNYRQTGMNPWEAFWYEMSY